MNGSKGWFDNFRKRFGLKIVKIIGKGSSIGQEAGSIEFLEAINKIIEGEGYLSEQVFIADISTFVLGWGECHKKHLLVGREIKK